MYKLFIADDEKIIIQGLKKLLDWNSLNIDIAGESTNGEDAENLIMTIIPDIAILDIRMPMRTGLDILHTINKKQIPTKVIFLSAYEEFRYARDALESGAHNYLTKPVAKEKLREAVESALRHIEDEKSARIAIERITRIDRESGINANTGGEFDISRLMRAVDNIQIRRVLQHMNEHFAENISLERVAKIAYMNPYYFSVYFKKNTGLHFKECITKIRLEHAAALLRSTDIKTYELAKMAGFTDPRYFSELFKRIYGRTPLEYKRAVKDLMPGIILDSQE